MRLLFTNDAPLIKYGLAAGFEQLGQTVLIMQGATGRLWGIPPEEQQRRLTVAIKSFRPDIIFSEGHPQFEPALVCGIARRFGIPHLYWAIEDPICTDLTISSYGRLVDLIFTTAEECIPRYRGLGKKTELLLFGCNPQFHYYTGIRPEYAHDIVLVASNYSSRYEAAEWLVMPLVEGGYDIKIWGLWWDDVSRPVNLSKHPQVYGGQLPYELLPTVYSSAKIILGMNCDASSNTQTSMRPYEVLACGGGLLLGHYTKAQERLFGSRIYQTHNADDTLATVGNLLAMKPEERHELATKAREWVCKEHSYLVRAQQILSAYQSLISNTKR